MVRPLLAIDAGERDDEPDALYAAAHLLHIACGGHAGDRASMERALAACRARGLFSGAHPSYPDRAGFGRASIAIAPAALAGSIREQVSSLRALGDRLGVPITHLKLHGALYHDAHRDPALALLVVEAALEALGHDATLVGPSGGGLEAAARRARQRFAREGFADRASRPDGSLVPRGEPGALILDPREAARRAEALARAGHDVVSIHADTEGALAIGAAVRAALDALRDAP